MRLAAVAGAFALLAAAMFLAAMPQAAARERIISYASEMWVEADATVLVRETIEVEAEGVDIKRGIYRDFPTDYRDRHNLLVRVAFDVESVKRDGRDEPYFTEKRSNGVRLYVGDADVFISHGRHVYEITYRTDRQLGFFEDFDEFYWNVTGTGWLFDIERVTARVHLPDGAGVLEAVAFTGRQGEEGTDFTVGLYGDDDVWFQTNRPLQAGEGLTVAVSWPKGFVSEPGASDKLWWFVRDNAAVAGAIAGVIALFFYYLHVWRLVGRDPEGGTIIPRYDAPEGVSPAAARYITRMGFDNTAFTAAIVSMATKGFVRIKQSTSGKYTLIKTAEGTAHLSNGERAVARKLFRGSRTEIEMKQKNHKAIGGARTALQGELQKEFEATHFVHNRKYFFIGAAVSVVAHFIMVLGAKEPLGAAFISVWLLIWTVGVAALLVRVWGAWSVVLSGGGWGNVAVAIPSTLFAVPFIIGWFMGLGFFTVMASVLSAIMVIVLVAINLVFYHLLKAPTLLGRQVLDEIEGFKLFLGVTEKDRLNLLNPPERTPELFERFLPYALALGVEQQWSEQFADVLAAIRPQADGQAYGYHPGWYSGRAFDGNIGSMTSSLGSGLSSAISSSSTAPGSSSGSSGGFSGGGGGSSGGGGGGGGGGGW